MNRRPPLTDVLTRIADQARPARIDPDTRRRGIRRRRTRHAAVVALAVVTVGVTAVLLPVPGTGPDVAPAGTAARVPSTVYSPLIGQGTVDESPPGPAAIVVAGDHELRGSDVWGWEGRSLVVGQDGRYRLARTVGETDTGLGGLLPSPDGRFLADRPWLEGARWPADGREQTVVVDLTTGKLVQYDGGAPVRWSPDGSALLQYAFGPDGDPGADGELRLLDLATGRSRPLPGVPGLRRAGDLASFSPDGSRIAVATGQALYVVDVAGNTVRKLADLTAADRLAGPGAWLPDGGRIALYTVDRCVGDAACAEESLRNRLFRLRYVDVDDGRPTDGPTLAPARGLAARLLGWQRDGAAVVATYEPEKGLVKVTGDPNWSDLDWWAVGGVDLAAFRTDGSRHRLVELPESALFVEVPAGLLDSFGGPAPSRIEGAVRRFLALYWPFGQIAVLLVVLVVAVGTTVRWWRRRRRLRPRPAAGR
ncbi:hypothetical protein [Micromonospora sp. NBRC 101691]|uniref:hypothetical protein n=1 Tax=Micromonospora sp. NBRC 101691 TaxID=3032198 RepID=UPI0024A4E7B7|nr:hypothetical protein [Micromonospora sp. NBRC 101691]GLY20744.1 hypothetical protein Misp04_04760 [Micromonospora sp. NBRC 101691]